MFTGRAIGAMAGGAVLGAAQTIGFRELDNYLATEFLAAKQKGQSPTPPFLMKQLGNFGSTSVIGNGILSAAELGIGIYGARKNKLIRSQTGQAVLITAGGAGLTGTVGSMAFPPTAWSNAVKVDPSRPYRGPGSSAPVISGGGAPTRSQALGAAVVG